MPRYRKLNNNIYTQILAYLYTPMSNHIATIDQYISAIPDDRKASFERLRDICKTQLETLGFVECINYKMLGYVVSKDDYPAGYHCDTSLPLPFVNLANQKWSINLYHMGIYAQPDLLAWFVEQRPQHAKRKLDMWKSCIRFKKIDDIPFDLIAELLGKISRSEWISLYETNLKK